MVRVLSGEMVRAVLDYPAAISALSDAHVGHARGEVVMPVRLRMTYDDRPSELVAMPAYLGSAPAVGVKLFTSVGTNAARGIPAIHAVIVLFDPDTGRPILIMDGRHATAVRTAAASALATRLLSRPDSHVLAIVGAGVQGRSHLEGMLSVRPIDSLRLHDADPARARAMADEVAGSHPSLEVQVAASTREAVADADVVCTCTTSPTPILEWEWLAPGAHINAVGAHSPRTRELATGIVTRSQIVVDSREAALEEAGDLLIPVLEGELDPSRIDTDLGQVAAGLRPGRQHAEAVTLYKSLGLGLQDIAVALLVMERAEQQGIGTTIDL